MCLTNRLFELLMIRRVYVHHLTHPSICCLFSIIHPSIPNLLMRCPGRCKPPPDERYVCQLAGCRGAS